MKKKSFFRRLITLLFFVGAGLAFLISIGATVKYVSSLATDIESRFAGRRWNIPSRVYSDTTLVYVGQTINRSLLEQKLDRLGYRRMASPPSRQGEMRVAPDRLEIYLHEFKSPTFRQESIPVEIRFDGNRVHRISLANAGENVSLIELEPEELMLYFGPDREQRLILSSRELPPHLINAVLAAEDHRFYKHHGFEIKSILRAFFANLQKGAIAQGGSTITQQLAKNYFLTPERTFKRKLKELLISLILEYRYSKDEILEIYLNEIYYGQKGSVSINGIGEAAQFYFDKRVENLSLAEAATLAGLIKAPNHYSPYLDLERCLARRNWVLQVMNKRGWLSETEYLDAVAQPLTPAGYSGYRRQAPYFMDYLTHQLTQLYTHDTLSSEGLSIFTTLDTQVQMAAEQALRRGLERLESIMPALVKQEPKERLQGAIVVMRPKTGYMLAMVGGRDYGTSQFNRVTHARRQPGSLFKPFVYLTGLQKFPLAKKLSNAPQTFDVEGTPWRPKNFNADAEPVVTVREALTHSYNIATVNLALAIGLDEVVKKAGSFHFSANLRPYPSIALGAFELTPLELARAYCAFAADGVLPYPLSIKDVTNENSQVIESRHLKVERLTSPAEAYIMNDLLRGVVISGTATSLKNWGVDWPVGGKTGTTNDYRDAWFVGYTPNILALIWVGFDNGTSLGTTGAGAALPIWADLITSLPQYESQEWFVMPPGVQQTLVCQESGRVATGKCCPRTMTELVLENAPASGACERHPCTSRLERFWKELKRIAP